MPPYEQATFGSGCFWCGEAVFSELNGVISVMPGYAGGHVPNPTYEQVCTGTTGHAEVFQVTFDPSKRSYEELVEVFFFTHDPTSLNRQGNDVGTEYRSVIFTTSEQQQHTASRIRDRLSAEKIFDRPIVTAIEPLSTFYPAEEYHRRYFMKNPDQAYCQFVIDPKIAHFRKKFSAWRKAE